MPEPWLTLKLNLNPLTKLPTVDWRGVRWSAESNLYATWINLFAGRPDSHQVAPIMINTDYFGLWAWDGDAAVFEAYIDNQAPFVIRNVQASGWVALDAVPWEIQLIDDLATRRIATNAYWASR